jgi:hypothetical protein
VHGDRLAAAGEEFAAALGHDFGDDRREILAEAVLVTDGDFRDLEGKRLCLGMQGLNRRCTERYAGPAEPQFPSHIGS